MFSQLGASGSDSQTGLPLTNNQSFVLGSSATDGRMSQGSAY